MLSKPISKFVEVPRANFAETEPSIQFSESNKKIMGLPQSIIET